jgi:hypothetical protein
MMNGDLIDSMLEIAVLIDTEQHATVERKTTPSFLKTSAVLRHYRRDLIEKTEDPIMHVQYLNELDAKLASISGEADSTIAQARQTIADLLNRLKAGLPS